MTASERFIEIVGACEGLPPAARAQAARAIAVEESQFDQSYIEFLDTQIRLSPRGPEWTARLRQRRNDLLPYCGVPLLSGVIPLGERHLSVYVIPEQKKVAHWEEYDYPYPAMQG